MKVRRYILALTLCVRQAACAMAAGSSAGRLPDGRTRRESAQARRSLPSSSSTGTSKSWIKVSRVPLQTVNSRTLFSGRPNLNLWQSHLDDLTHVLRVSMASTVLFREEHQTSCSFQVFAKETNSCIWSQLKLAYPTEAPWDHG